MYQLITIILSETSIQRTVTGPLKVYVLDKFHCIYFGKLTYVITNLMTFLLFSAQNIDTHYCFLFELIIVIIIKLIIRI